MQQTMKPVGHIRTGFQPITVHHRWYQSIVNWLLLFLFLSQLLPYQPIDWNNEKKLQCTDSSSGTDGTFIKLVHAAKETVKPPANKKPKPPPAVASRDDDGLDNVCETIKSGNKAGLTILCVGLIRDKIIMVTVDFYVYELPISSLKGTINKLYLSSKPEKLDKKWPQLARDKRWNQIKSHIYNSFTVMDSKSNYICFTTVEKDGYGLNYDINNGKAVTGFQYTGKDKQVLLSSTQDLSYYALHKSDEGDLQIASFAFSGKTVEDSDTIDDKTAFFSICAKGPDGGFNILNNGSDTCAKYKQKTVDWPVLKGFVADGKFYLFGSTFVVIFSQEAYNDKGKPQESSKVSYSGFFRCQGHLPRAITKKSSPLIGIIIAVVLVILILILLCVLFIRKKQEADKKKKLKQGKTTTTTKSGKPPTVAGGGLSQSSSRPTSKHSVRSSTSGSHFKPGMLTRKSTSSSKHASSKGSNIPSARSSRSSTKHSTKLSGTSSSKKSTNSAGPSTSKKSSNYSSSKKSSHHSRASQMMTGRSGLSNHSKSSKFSKSSSKNSSTKKSKSGKLSAAVTGRSNLSYK